MNSPSMAPTAWRRHRYDDLLRMISDGSLQPERLIARRVDLAEGAAILADMADAADSGIAVIDRFGA